MTRSIVSKRRRRRLRGKFRGKTQRMRLSREDHVAFFGALDNPPEPTPALVEAMRRYRKALAAGDLRRAESMDESADFARALKESRRTVDPDMKLGF